MEAVAWSILKKLPKVKFKSQKKPPKVSWSWLLRGQGTKSVAFSTVSMNATVGAVFERERLCDLRG